MRAIRLAMNEANMVMPAKMMIIMMRMKTEVEAVILPMTTMMRRIHPKRTRQIVASFNIDSEFNSKKSSLNLVFFRFYNCTQ